MNMNQQHIKHQVKNFFESKTVRKIFLGVVVFLIALMIFQAGIFVGFHKASFAYRLGENYYKGFDGRHRGVMMTKGMKTMGIGIPGGHGAVGKVVQVSQESLVIESSEGVEKTIALGTSTKIKADRDSLEAKSIKVGDFVVVIGTPGDDVVINALLVRILPPPPEGEIKVRQ